MKKSFYNIESRLPDGTMLIGNLLSGVMIQMTGEDYALFRAFHEGQECLDPPGLQKMLTEGRFLISDDFDELAYIESCFNYQKFRTDVLSLTILPTMDCNFDCVYCYENNTCKYMNERTMNALINYVAVNLQGKKVLTITWYGGEPLLAQETIWKLSRFFREICEKLRVKYVASIITNGSLLTGEVVDKLLSNGITRVQITIDGPPKIHNMMRPFSRQRSSGPETFDLVLGNANNVCDRIKTAIRINIDRENISQLHDLLQMPLMQALKERINGIYCSPLLPFGVGAKVKNARFLHNCYSPVEFAEIEFDIARIFEQYGFSYGYVLDGSECGCCRAVSVNNWVIDPDGNMLKCWDCLGDDSAILGNIANPPIDEPIRENEGLLKWLSFTPFHRNECRKCKVLPVCMGGCPHRSLIVNANSNYRCAFLKFNYKRMLHGLYKSSTRRCLHLGLFFLHVFLLSALLS